MRKCVSRAQRSIRAFSRAAAAAQDHDISGILQLVEQCCERKILSEAVQLQFRIRELGIPQDGLVGASVVRMFIKCRSVKDARCVFEGMSYRANMVLWTSMVTAYVDCGDCDQGWAFFFRMQQEGVLPDRVTFISILNACSCAEKRNLIHRLIIEKGVESNVVVGNALVKIYGKCLDLEGAARLFKRMPCRDVISWTGMISANSQFGDHKEALVYYYGMQLEGVLPNNITFLAALGACLSLAEGKLVHANIVEAEWESDTMVANALINMFSKCGSLEDARLVFQGMKQWNVTSWNAMIGACTQHGFNAEALELFRSMQQQQQQQQQQPNKITLVSVLGACEILEDGKMIHHSAAVGAAFESDVVLGTALVNMYCRCGSLSDARRVFEAISEKNVVSWNTLIAAYCHDESLRSDTIDLFRRMLFHGVKPTKTTVLNVMNAVVSLDLAKQLRSWILTSGLYSDLFIGSALVNMFERAGSFADARRAFESIVERDVFSWNAIIVVCIKQGFCGEALEQFEKMLVEGTAANRATFLVTLDAFPNSDDGLTGARRIHSFIREAGFESDTSVANALISMYSRCGSLEDCRKTFEQTGDKSVVTWTSMIAACKDLGSCEEAIEVFQRMDLQPDKVTLTTALEACTEISARREGKIVHSRVVEAGLETDLYVATALIHMYSKLGCMDEVAKVFGKIDLPNLACWNAMLGGYAQTGHTQEVIDFFQSMQLCGMQPDHITFLGLVSACSHVGDVERGVRYFAAMSLDFGVRAVVEDYGCLVDLLARAGELIEADEFVRRMPFKPSDVMWKSLVAACKVQGDVRRGKNAASKVLEKEPRSAAAYVELYNMSVTDGIKM